MGLTLMRLLTTGMPNLSPTSLQVATSLAGVFGDLGAHPVGEHVEIVAGAVEKADAERHGTHIEVFVAQHVQGAEDFTICKHGNFLREVCFDTDGTCPSP